MCTTVMAAAVVTTTMMAATVATMTTAVAAVRHRAPRERQRCRHRSDVSQFP
jgi:hypothetical protein